MRISGSSSDVCSSDLSALVRYGDQRDAPAAREVERCRGAALHERVRPDDGLERDGNLMIGAFSGEPFRQLEAAPDHGLEAVAIGPDRSEEHTSELQSLMRISYACSCFKKKKKQD